MTLSHAKKWLRYLQTDVNFWTCFDFLIYLSFDVFSPSSSVRFYSFNFSISIAIAWTKYVGTMHNTSISHIIHIWIHLSNDYSQSVSVLVKQNQNSQPEKSKQTQLTNSNNNNNRSKHLIEYCACVWAYCVPNWECFVWARMNMVLKFRIRNEKTKYALYLLHTKSKLFVLNFAEAPLVWLWRSQVRCVQCILYTIPQRISIFAQDSVNDQRRIRQYL